MKRRQVKAATAELLVDTCEISRFKCVRENECVLERWHKIATWEQDEMANEKDR